MRRARVAVITEQTIVSVKEAVLPSDPAWQSTTLGKQIIITYMVIVPKMFLGKITLSIEAENGNKFNKTCRVVVLGKRRTGGQNKRHHWKTQSAMTIFT